MNGYVHLKLIHKPVGVNEGGSPQKIAGRNVGLQIVDSHGKVLGDLGGVMSVRENFPLDGVTNVELTIGAFHEAIEEHEWPSYRTPEPTG